MNVACVILAAGNARRFGANKSGLELAGVTFGARALAAAATYPTTVVGGPDDPALERDAERFGARFVKNSQPERGMSHSLRLAYAAIADPRTSLAVLLVDMPFVDADVVARVIAASLHAEIAFPIAPDGRTGHPVVFGPRACAAIEALPDGDTLRDLRMDPRFRSVGVEFSDHRPFTDVDTRDEFERIDARFALAQRRDAASKSAASPNE